MKLLVQFYRSVVLVLLVLSVYVPLCLGAGQQPTPGVPTSRTITINGTGSEITSSAGAQSLAANRTWTLSLPSALDFTSKTLKIPNSTTPPGGCLVGQIYFDTDATAGQNIFGCTSAGTWTLQGWSGSGTVTSIATTSPITGGTITTTGTIGCATCTTNATALTANLPVIGAGGQAVTAGSVTGTTTVFVAQGSPVIVTPTIASFLNANHDHTNVAGGGTLTGAALSASVTLGVAGTSLGKLALTGNTSGTVTIQPQAVAGTYNFNLPTSAGSSGQPLLSGGGGATAMTFGTLGVGGGGTGATTLTANGVLYGNGTSALNVTAQGSANSILVANAGAPSFSQTPTINTSLTLGVASSQTGSLVFKNSTNANTFTFQPGVTASNLTFTLPTTDSTGTQCLSSNGSGVLSWSACSAGSGTPGGSTTQVQYNNAGSFGGSTGLTFDGTTILSKREHVTAVGTNTTLGTHDVVAVTTSGTNYTTTLPVASAGTVGQRYEVTKVDSG